jgi:hypothetical protein
MIRRLTSDDAALLRKAYSWDEGRPLWYRQMDAVFNSGSVGDLITQLNDARYAFIGVWDDDEFVSVIIVDQHDAGQFEGHLMTRTGTDVALIQTVIQHLLVDLLNFGLAETFVWIAEKNRGVRKLCGTIGFQPDGLAMYRGTYRGKSRDRVIKWIRYSIQREQILMAQAA